MIRISKKNGYLVGMGLMLAIYFTGQAIRIKNMQTVKATICDISETVSGQLKYYACFRSAEGEDITVYAGSNIGYQVNGPITLIYNPSDPWGSKPKNFKSMWMIPILYYLIPFAFILAGITGLYFGTKYVVICKRPFRIYLEDFLRPTSIEQRLR